MKYTAHTQRSFLICLACLSLLLGALNRDVTIVLGLAIAMCTLCILLARITYSCWIKKGSITYEVRIFGLKMYAKRIDVTDIKKVVFKRTGWQSKSAIIQRHKGFSIRVASFKPQTIYQDIIAFCDTHEVQYVLTDSYKLST